MNEENIDRFATLIAAKVAEKTSACHVFDTEEIHMLKGFAGNVETARKVGFVVLVGTVVSALALAVWTGFCILVNTGRLPKA